SDYATKKTPRKDPSDFRGLAPRGRHFIAAFGRPEQLIHGLGVKLDSGHVHLERSVLEVVRAFRAFPDQNDFATPRFIADAVADYIIERVGVEFSRALEIEQKLMSAIRRTDVAAFVFLEAWKERFANAHS